MISDSRGRDYTARQDVPARAGATTGGFRETGFMLELFVAFGAILAGAPALLAHDVQPATSSAKEPSAPKAVPLDRSLFARVIDSLGDVEPRVVQLARLETAPTSVKAEAMSVLPGVRLVPGPSEGSWQLVSDTGTGAPAVLGCFEMSGLDLKWSWRRNSTSTMADALAQADRLLSGLRLTVSFENRPVRAFEVVSRTEAPKVAAPVPPASAPASGAVDEALLARAIRAAEVAHQAEATAYSKRATEQAGDRLRNEQEADDKARDKRNSTKADDRHGRPGNGVSNRDDNFDERLRGGGRPDGPKYVVPPSWGDLMKAEVEAELKRDPQAGKKGGRPLYAPSHPLAGPQLQKFVRSWRGLIADARIKTMLERVVAEYQRLAAESAQEVPPAPQLLPDAKAPLPPNPLQDPSQKTVPGNPPGREPGR